MKIDPKIMQRHLRLAAIEQVCQDLKFDGFTIEAIEAGPIDILARRGDQLVAAEVRVPGTIGRARLLDAVTEARKLGASFRLHLLGAEPRAIVHMDRLADSLLEAARDVGSEKLDFPSGWTIESVDDITVAIAVIETERLDVHGQAVVYARGNGRQEGVPVAFDLGFDGARRLLDGADVRPLDD